jgi:hypothetical protein
VGVTLASRDGNVKPRALLTELLTQIVKAAPISRCERGKASEKYIEGMGPIPGFVGKHLGDRFNNTVAHVIMRILTWTVEGAEEVDEECDQWHFGGILLRHQEAESGG